MYHARQNEHDPAVTGRPMAVSRLHTRELIQCSPQGVDHNGFGHHLVFFQLDLLRTLSVNPAVFLGMLQIKMHRMHALVEERYTHTHTTMYLHAHEEVSRLPPVEASRRELVTHPLHLGAFLWRTQVGDELPK